MSWASAGANNAPARIPPRAPDSIACWKSCALPVITANVSDCDSRYAARRSRWPELSVIGIKDSSGQRDLLAAYLESQSDTFAVITGNAQLFQHAMESGARGGILAGALFAPALAHDIYRATLAGNAAAASAAQAR